MLIKRSISVLTFSTESAKERTIYDLLWSDTHITSTLRGERGEGVWQKWEVIGWRGWGVSKCSRHLIFIFFIKENWICAITRHHAEPNNISLTRNLAVSHPVMIPLHCVWAKSNNRTRGQFECDVVWFCFVLISLVHVHGAVVVP